MSNGLNSNAKLFADVMWLFFVFDNITDSANLLNSGVSKITKIGCRMEMSFNPDPTERKDCFQSQNLT